jgi:Ca2+-binding RTX toxin-like protein
MAAIEIPSGNTQYLIDDDDKTYVLKANATRTADGVDSAIAVNGTSAGDTLNLKGDVEQTDLATWAIQVSGTDMTVNIATSGTILGNGGIEFNGDNAILTNAGSITATAASGDGIYYEGLNTSITNTGTVIASSMNGVAIYAAGVNSTIENDGKLQGAYGIQVADARTTINLEADSNIIGKTAAIFSENTEATDKISVTNHGHITGQGKAFAIELGDSDDSVVNQGTITGRINMGTGKDVFDNRGGTVDHAIEGGAGDDTLITDNAHVKLKENGGSEGFDTVKSTVTYTLSANVEQLILLGKANIDGTGTNDGDDLFGNKGKNHLFGLNGSDALSGGKADDLLTGGTNDDTFVFKTGYGHDTITDFDKHGEHDKIDLSGWTGISSFDDVKQHWSMDNGDLVITLGKDELILFDTAKSAVHDTDFIFA